MSQDRPASEAEKQREEDLELTDDHADEVKGGKVVVSDIPIVKYIDKSSSK
jgi:hypothetical protein